MRQEPDTAMHTRTLAALVLPSLLLAQTSAPPVFYRVSTFAGVPWSATLPATAPDIMFKAPFGVAYDRSGNLYVANYEMHSVRKIEPNGRSVTVAGDGVDSRLQAPPEVTARRLTFPRALAVDGDRYLYIGEPIASRIKRLDLRTNQLETIIGGRGGFSLDGTPGVNAQLNEVLGLAVDNQGNLLFAETGSHRIRKWDASTGLISTVAGNGSAGFTGDGGPAIEARLNRPAAVAAHPNGDIYFFDFENRRVRIVRGGTIATVAGTPAGNVSQGPGAQVNFGASTAIGLDPAGRNLYVASESAHRIFKLQLSDAIVTVLAGTGASGRPVDGVDATASPLFTPTGVVADAAGGVVIAEVNNHRIRRVGPDGIIRALAGLSRFGLEGSVPPDRAVLDFAVPNPGSTGPTPIRLSPNGTLVIVDRGNCLIRAGISNSVSILVGNQGTCTIANPLAAVMDNERNVFWTAGGNLFYRRVGGAAVSRFATFATAMTISDDGASLTLAEPGTNRILRVPRAAVLGTAPVTPSVLAGSTAAGFVDGDAQTSRFAFPYDIAEGPSGDIYVADVFNRAIRRIRGGATTTVLRDAEVYSATLDSSERLWVAGFNFVFGSSETSPLVLGGLETGFSPNGAAGGAIQFGGFVFVTGGRNGTVYIADMYNNVVRQAVPVTVRGLEIVDGDNQTGIAGSALPAPLRVRVMGSDGAPLSGMGVRFSASHLQPPVTLLSNADGIVSLRATLPPTEGPVTFTAAAVSGPPVTFRATAIPPGPAIAGVAVAPRYSGSTRIASGSWIEIRGTALAGEAAESAEGANTLGGARVLVNDTEAMLVSVSSARIICVVPDGVPEGSARLSVLREGMPPAVREVPIAARAIALLAPPELRDGGKQFVHAILEGGALAGPAGLTPATRPAKPGDKMILTMNGAGTAPSEVKIYLGESEAVTASTAGPLGTHRIEVTVPSGATGELSVGMIVDGALVELDLWTVVE